EGGADLALHLGPSDRARVRRHVPRRLIVIASPAAAGGDRQAGQGGRQCEALLQSSRSDHRREPRNAPAPGRDGRAPWASPVRSPRRLLALLALLLGGLLRRLLGVLLGLAVTGAMAVIAVVTAIAVVTVLIAVVGPGDLVGDVAPVLLGVEGPHVVLSRRVLLAEHVVRRDRAVGDVDAGRLVVLGLIDKSLRVAAKCHQPLRV